MDGSFGQLRLYTGGAAAAAPVAPPRRPDDPTAIANRELIRPPTYRRGHHDLEPYSPAWLEELGRKRYARHGRWLPAALEFGRHPGESVLLFGPGVGSDAVRYLAHGTDVTVAATPADDPALVRANWGRSGAAGRVVPAAGGRLPFADGAFDVAVVNALHDPAADTLPDELFRVLKAGGKVIGLFPAYYDAGYWQDLVLPLQHWYWRRPPDPTSAPKKTRAQLVAAFARFTGHAVGKRHLRRSELPHPCRVLPSAVLERLVGRVLVFKAFKPLTAARSGSVRPYSPDALAA